MPFGKRSRDSCPPLSADQAASWLSCAFGRGEVTQASLKRADVLVASIFATRLSVVRAQHLVAHALTNGQFGSLASQIDRSCGGTSVFVMKRVWDETAHRLQISHQVLQDLFPGAFADEVARVAQASSQSYPGFVVQSMQQVCFARWSAGPGGGEEIIIPACLIPTTTAKAIYSAVMHTVPSFDVERVK